MHHALANVHEQVEYVIRDLNSHIGSDEPFGIVHNSWNFPCITRSELVEDAQSIMDLIESNPVDDLGSHEERIDDYTRRLEFLRSNVIPNIWGNAAYGVPTFQITINGLRKALLSVLDKDTAEIAQKRLRSMNRQIRGIESQVKDLKPRSAELSSMVGRIEQAYESADRLPTDLETLDEAQKKVEKLLRGSVESSTGVEKILDDALVRSQKLSDIAEEADTVLEQCKMTYASATSVQLAAAFSERSDMLAKSVRLWSGGLFLVLATGASIGYYQFGELAELIREPKPGHEWIVVLNLVMSFLSIGAPVWFAWLATKQIGQRFRLAEDYAFKASISRAYEGFRRETARIDKEMEKRLLDSALERLDELPLRLLEAHVHGSPWHEVTSSDAVRTAMKTVPTFVKQVKDLARDAVNYPKSKRGLVDEERHS